MTAWAVTGAGLVSVAGSSPEALFDAIASGRARLTRNDSLDVACAPIEGFDPKRHLDRKGLGDLSRTSQLACAAASLLAPALGGVPPAEVGVVLGTAWGSLKTVVAFERAAQVDGPRFVDPFLFAETVANVPAGQIAIVFGWSACNATVSAGSASGLSALCSAIDLLVEERAQVVEPGSLPCAATRSGPVAGEGACLLAIESLERAAARGARPLARIAAAGSVSAIAGTTGARRAVSALAGTLLQEAGIARDQIDLIVLSANGDKERDTEEALGVMEVFGRGDAAPPLVAPKGTIGETWGAAGPLAAVVALEAMRRGTIPASPLHAMLDPALDGLRFPTEETRGEVRRAMILDGAAGELIAGIVLENGGSDAA